MNKTYAGSSSRPGGKRPSGKRPITIAGVLGAVALIGYALVQPQLNERYGWNLPSLTDRQVEQRDADRDADVGTQTADQIVTDHVPSQTVPSTGQPHGDQPAVLQGQTAERQDSSPSAEDTNPPAVSGGVDDSQPPAIDDPTLRYGFLRQTGRDRFISPAGLQYLPGSQEGHRLEHIKRHTQDQPNRPGSHGVFDGDMAAVVRMLDEAYLKAKQDATGVTTEQDQGRTIYTINMGKRIGYVGGREGNRRRKPMARRLRLVLEGTRVITAYPL